jgi:hypothetical protein
MTRTRRWCLLRRGASARGEETAASVAEFSRTRRIGGLRPSSAAALPEEQHQRRSPLFRSFLRDYRRRLALSYFLSEVRTRLMR